MAQERKFTCDICGTPISDPSNLKPWTSPGIGLYHINGAIARKLCIEAERHICLRCLSALQKISIEPGA